MRSKVRVGSDISSLIGIQRKPNGQAQRGTFKVIAPEVMRLRESGVGAKKIARKLGVDITTVNRAVKLAKESKKPSIRTYPYQPMKVELKVQPLKEFLMRLNPAELSLKSADDGATMSFNGKVQKISSKQYDALLSTASLLGVKVYELREVTSLKA